MKPPFDDGGIYDLWPDIKRFSPAFWELSRTLPSINSALAAGPRVRLLIEGQVRRDKRKQKVDQMAAAILLQSYLDSTAA